MHPVLIQIGDFQIPTYGVLVALALVVGLALAKRRAVFAGLDGNKIVDMGLWVVLVALIGAKLTLLLIDPSFYLKDLAHALELLRSGGVFLGGLISGLVAALFLTRKYRLPILPVADAVAPSVAVGHAIGRVGCLMAGCCWGAKCNLPWAIVYTDPRAYENVGTPLGVPLHPFPIYASLFNFSLFLFLERLYRKHHASPGLVSAAYLMIYGVGRFLLEFTRGDEGRGFVLGGLLSTSQAISLLMVVGGVFLYLVVIRRR